VIDSSFCLSITKNPLAILYQPNRFQDFVNFFFFFGLPLALPLPFAALPYLLRPVTQERYALWCAALQIFEQKRSCLPFSNPLHQ